MASGGCDRDGYRRTLSGLPALICLGLSCLKPVGPESNLDCRRSARGRSSSGNVSYPRVPPILCTTGRRTTPTPHYSPKNTRQHRIPAEHYRRKNTSTRQKSKRPGQVGCQQCWNCEEGEQRGNITGFPLTYAAREVRGMPKRYRHPPAFQITMMSSFLRLACPPLSLSTAIISPRRLISPVVRDYTDLRGEISRSKLGRETLGRRRQRYTAFRLKAAPQTIKSLKGNNPNANNPTRNYYTFAIDDAHRLSLGTARAWRGARR